MGFATRAYHFRGQHLNPLAHSPYEICCVSRCLSHARQEISASVTHEIFPSNSPLPWTVFLLLCAATMYEILQGSLHSLIVWGKSCHGDLLLGLSQ
ncbi:hypothetical protein FKM82_004480 [Ascaphus truei]